MVTVFHATFHGRFPHVRGPNEALIGHKWCRRNDRVSTSHSGSMEERKLERRKPPLSRARHQLRTSSWSSPQFARQYILRQLCHSFCDARHGIVFLLRSSAAGPSRHARSRGGLESKRHAQQEKTRRFGEEAAGKMKTELWRTQASYHRPPSLKCPFCELRD